MSTRSRSSLVSILITCGSVMRSVSTPRGMKCPQHQKTAGTFRPLERGIGNGFDIFAFDVRQQATHIRCGVLIGSLTVEEPHKGLHEGVEAWHDLLENLWGDLTFVQQLAFAQGVSCFHGLLLL